MSKTFLYRFFGLGKLPASVLAPLEAEGIVLFDEGIRATVVDKGSKPEWRPATLEEVGENEIEAYFAPLPEGELVH